MSALVRIGAFADAAERGNFGDGATRFCFAQDVFMAAARAAHRCCCIPERILYINSVVTMKLVHQALHTRYIIFNSVTKSIVRYCIPGTRYILRGAMNIHESLRYLYTRCILIVVSPWI